MEHLEGSELRGEGIGLIESKHLGSRLTPIWLAMGPRKVT